MKKQTLLIITSSLSIGILLGYFIGREHLKHEIKSATEKALADFNKNIASAFGVTPSSPNNEKVQSKPVSSKKAAEEKNKLLEIKQNYMKNIDLYDLEAKYYDTYSNKNVPGINFKLKNNGNKTLNKVEVTVYFKNKEGITIAEEDYNPVLVSTYSYGDNKPLKPNYIWQNEKDKFYQAKSVPNEWEEGNVTAKITDITFADE